ncbi:MAG: DUF1549 domain-containing protein [Candidatus Hydrogenedens sp.]|nr:DUF1549 domain-containing protein [Candidatus Hydrogenedens sp.]
MRLMKHSITATFRAFSLAALGVAAVAGAAQAQQLAVYPPDANLENIRDIQGVVLQYTRPDGVTLDVTAQAQAALEPAGLAAWDPAQGLIPQADGETTATFTYEGQTVSMPVKVSNAAADPPMSFRHDVLPVLFRAGCNSGGCHGSAKGKNGFHMTLFGYGPEEDYISITRQAQSRRMDIAMPEDSLVLTKPAGLVPHEGGDVLAEGSALYAMLERWIAEGAQNDPAEVKSLADIEILPKQAVLEGEGATQRFTVRAKYTDGSDRDVTKLAILASSDDMTLKVDGDGIATSGQRGEVYIMARFGSFAVVSQAIVIPSDLDLQWPEDAQPLNYIDEYVFAKLRKVRVPPAERCSDTAFVRRLYLDVLGTVPTIEEAEEFLNDPAPDKRAKLIDKLIERPEFSNLWAMKWAEVLRIKPVPNILDEKGMNRYNDWLRQNIAANRPMDELVRDLLTAEGGNFTNPASNFFVIESDPTVLAENVAQVFMGVQLKCAQCHNHPFERWTMNDYYGFAAFFAQVGRKNSTDPRERIIYDSRSGEVKHLHTQEVMAPRYLGGDLADVQNRDRRKALAEWLTAPENPWFAKNIANRVWAHFLGGGIVDPPDDVRVTNPPANPDLLDELGRRMVEYKYDLRSLVRDVCNSYTYQMSTRPRTEESGDTRNFAVARLRRLTAEQMLEAISVATRTDVKFAGLPLGSKPVEIAGQSSNYFLNIFGRPARDSVCTCDRTNEPTLAQSLHLINGDTINAAIQKPEGALAGWIAEEIPTNEAVRRMYLAAVARPPSEEEVAQVEQYVNESEDKKAALEDAFWSVLNSKEFIFNH